MVGLSEADMEQIEDFANTPRYARNPTQLSQAAEAASGAEEEPAAD